MALPNLSDEDRDIGVVFRYQDIDNFYRFAMDQARGRRLIARVAGTETTLAVDTSTYDLNTSHNVEILARGRLPAGWNQFSDWVSESPSKIMPRFLSTVRRPTPLTLTSSST